MAIYLTEAGDRVHVQGVVTVTRDRPTAMSDLIPMPDLTAPAVDGLMVDHAYQRGQIIQARDGRALCHAPCPVRPGDCLTITPNSASCLTRFRVTQVIRDGREIWPEEEK